MTDTSWLEGYGTELEEMWEELGYFDECEEEEEFVPTALDKHPLRPMEY